MFARFSSVLPWYPSPQRGSSSCRTSLCFAAQRGHREATATLLARKAHSESADWIGHTAASWAAKMGQKDIAAGQKGLLSSGEGAILSVWGIHLPYIGCLVNGGPRSFLEFPNHLRGWVIFDIGIMMDHDEFQNG